MEKKGCHASTLQSTLWGTSIDLAAKFTEPNFFDSYGHIIHICAQIGTEKKARPFVRCIFSVWSFFQIESETGKSIGLRSQNRSKKFQNENIFDLASASKTETERKTGVFSLPIYAYVWWWPSSNRPSYSTQQDLYCTRTSQDVIFDFLSQNNKSKQVLFMFVNILPGPNRLICFNGS
jgi:hypothetical protein